MKSNLAVIAGTPVDTEFGESYLKKITTGQVFSYAISKSPNQQNYLQLNHPEKLYQICLNKCRDFKDQGAEKVVIYCNSLAASIDVGELERESSIPIITPLQVYSTIPKSYQRVLIVAANNQGASLPERIILETIPDCETITFGFLPLVNQIEQKQQVEKIYEEMALKNLVGFVKDLDVDLFLLACTHFPYISQKLKDELNGIKVLDLDEGLLDLIKSDV